LSLDVRFEEHTSPDGMKLSTDPDREQTKRKAGGHL
jgi:hypothetical protein